MRKFCTVLLALTLLVLPCVMPIAKASDTQDLITCTYTNTTGTAAVSYISATTVIKGKHRVLGFTVAPITSGSGTSAGGIYDAASVSDLSDTNFIGESVQANTTTGERILPYPKPLSNGLAIWAGAQCTVTVYLERSKP